MNWMPPVPARVGDRVLFYLGADSQQEPQTAQVVEVRGRSVSLEIILRGAFQRIIKPEVHHIADPRLLESVEIRSEGAWEHHPDKLKLLELEAELAALKAELGVKKK